MQRIIRIFPICIFLIITLSISLKAEDNEKVSMLRSSSLGDWDKAKKIKKSGKILLQVWDPYIDYAKTVQDKSMRNVMLQNINKNNIDYNEIWIWERNDLFTPAERKKFRGQFDIHKLYWKDNKVQGFTLEKYYISNPINNKKIGKHKITQVWDRDMILREISK
jgi:hypothetical protein